MYFPSQANFYFIAETLSKNTPFLFPCCSSAMNCVPVPRQEGKGVLIQQVIDGYVGCITNFTNGNFTNGT